MKRISSFPHASTLAGIVLLSVLVILVATPHVVAQEAYPANSAVFGMTYGDWEAAYFQYVFSIPAGGPMLDASGADCNDAQPAGPVFFLNLIPDHAFFPAGFAGSYAIRTCTIPARALFIPVAGWECSSIQSYPSHGYNPQDMRKCAATAVDGLDPKSLRLVVDGKNLSELVKERRVQSPYFDFTLPAMGSVLGDDFDGILAGSAVADGYYVILKPLSPGRHVVQFGGAWLSGQSPIGLPGPFSVLYNLTVQ